MKKKIFFHVFLVLVSFCFCSCDPPNMDDDSAFCWSSFGIYQDAPNEISFVKIEVYQGDSLIGADGGLSYTRIDTGLRTEGDSLTLNISIYCNGQWVQGEDYSFVVKQDSIFAFRLNLSNENGVDIFNEEQKKICPSLSGLYLHKEIDLSCQEYQKQK